MNSVSTGNNPINKGQAIQGSGTTDAKVFSFAQLTDPHLSTLLGVRARDLLGQRILGYLSWRKNRRWEHRANMLDLLVQDMAVQAPDHVVVTGDLTHLGLPSECRQVQQWLQALGNPADVTVIPGNHDTYVRTSWPETLGLWEPYMVSDPATSNAAALDDCFPSLRVRGSVALIGLSSARPSAPFFAVGSLGSRQLAVLEELLQSTREQQLFRVVLVHHAPVPSSDKWRKRLTDSRDLCNVLEKQGVELVLHGHTHRAMESELETVSGKARVIGLPSASAMGRGHGEPARYQIYRVNRRDNGWDLSIHPRGYVQEQGGFEALHERQIRFP